MLAPHAKRWHARACNSRGLEPALVGWPGSKVLERQTVPPKIRGRVRTAAALDFLEPLTNH